MGSLLGQTQGPVRVNFKWAPGSESEPQSVARQRTCHWQCRSGSNLLLINACDGMEAGGAAIREHLARERSWWHVLTADEYLTDPLGRRSACGGQCECALRADAVGLLPDMRRLSGYYRAAEALLFDRALPNTDMT